MILHYITKQCQQYKIVFIVGTNYPRSHDNRCIYDFSSALTQCTNTNIYTNWNVINI